MISLGYICIAEDFPHTTYIIDKIITMAKEVSNFLLLVILHLYMLCILYNNILIYRPRI